jgi:hypothetical protein
VTDAGAAAQSSAPTKPQFHRTITAATSKNKKGPSCGFILERRGALNLTSHAVKWFEVSSMALRP